MLHLCIWINILNEPSPYTHATMCLPCMCVPKMCMHAHAHKPPWPVTMPHRGLWEKKMIFFFVLISLSKFVPFPMPYCHLGSMPHVAWQPPSPPSLPMYINHCCIESPVCESLLYCKEYVTYILLTYEVRQLSLSFQKKSVVTHETHDSLDVPPNVATTHWHKAWRACTCAHAHTN